MNSKNFYRKEFLEKRKALTQAQRDQLSFQLYNQFFAHIDLSAIKVLHIFLPLTSKGEPDTWLIIDRLRREYPGIRLVIPKVNETSQELEHFFFEGLHQLKKNKWGIEEPQQGVPAEVSKIDVVIVPMVICDQTGHRVGYGKGYYDKFLAQCRPDCQKIGLSFFQPVVKIEDTTTLDVALNYCITSEKIYSF
ncbi:MAG: 5-formyltetrahydrofolate cyclo-ligase [Flammeovirgaceae bacterium]|nr:5-formyltetrahydrofolate cyclo-ligase [Flammeovirgaceae bacterium]